MSNEQNLRKLNEDLYVENYIHEGKQGTIQWKREAEALSVVLNNVQCVFSSSTVVQEFSLFEHDVDSISDSSRITGVGTLERDSLRLIGSSDKRPFREIAQVSLRPADRDWNKIISATRINKKLSLSSSGLGKLWFYDKAEAEKNNVGIGDGDEFFLDLIVPKDQFWSLFQWLSIRTQPAVAANVTAQVATFRSEADRGLEDWDDPRRYFVERTSAACLSNISLTLNPTISSSLDEQQSNDRSGIGWPYALSPGNSTVAPLVKWMKLLFVGLVVLIGVQLLKS